MRKFNHKWSVWNIREWRHRTGSEGPVGIADIGIMRLSAWILTGMFVGTKTRDTFCFLENCLIKIVQTHTTCESSNLFTLYNLYIYYIYMCIFYIFIFVFCCLLSKLCLCTYPRFGPINHLGPSCSFFVGFPGRNYSAPDDELLMWGSIFAENWDRIFFWLASGQELGFNLLIFYLFL